MAQDRADFRKLMADCEEFAKAAENQERLDNKARWGSWCTDNLEGGAAKAHSYAKIPPSWRPSTALTLDDAVLADPLGVLQVNGDKYGGLWRARDAEPDLDVGHRSALPRIRVEAAREASLSFSAKTGTGCDGFHPRHLGMLGDDAISAWTAIILAAETLGVMPIQIRYIMFVLIPKATSGLRPIAMFCAMYRNWANIRQSECKSWEAAHERGYFAASAGRSAEDTVWRHAVDVECARADGLCCAAVISDFAAFYEKMSFERLWAQCHIYNFPITVVKVAISMYRGARFISHKAFVTFVGFALNGGPGGLCLGHHFGLHLLYQQL